MRSTIFGFVGAALALFLLVSMPASASALSTPQITAIVALLRSFGADPGVVNNVEATLSGNVGGSASSTTASTTTRPWMPGVPPGQTDKALCLALNRNLGPGSQGDDVKQLQQMLQSDPASQFTAQPTGVFGPLTAQAVARFQMHNGIASSTTGAVGSLTRAFLERRCGEGLMHQGGPGLPPPPDGHGPMHDRGDATTSDDGHSEQH